MNCKQEKQEIKPMKVLRKQNYTVLNPCFSDSSSGTSSFDESQIETTRSNSSRRNKRENPSSNQQAVSSKLLKSSLDTRITKVNAKVAKDGQDKGDKGGKGKPEAKSKDKGKGKKKSKAKSSDSGSSDSKGSSNDSKGGGDNNCNCSRCCYRPCGISEYLRINILKHRWLE